MTQQGYSGFATPTSGNDDYNQIEFIVSQVLARVSTAALVQVTSVTNVGEIAPVGLLNAIPMVHQNDGRGNVTPHGTLLNLPYVRIQGGTDAIIMDPKVGDIGLAVFAHRDISTVKATKKPGGIGSFRRNDWQDGIYVGMCLNGTPTQFVRFSEDGVHIATPVEIALDAPNVRTTGNLAVGTGASGTFVAATGQSITVKDGVVVNINPS